MLHEKMVLYHYSAGKDRTKLVSLLLLGLAGVEKHDIVSNYEISFTNMESKIGENLSKYPLNVIESHPQNIKMAYDYLMGDRFRLNSASKVWVVVSKK